MSGGKLQGNYSIYYLSGNIKAKHIYSHDVKKDSSVYYYDDLVNTVHQIDYYSGSDTIFAKDYYPGSAIRSTGKIHKQSKIGKWKYYKEDGILEKVFEYKTINGEQYTNQEWEFDSAGDTLKQLGCYYEIKDYPKRVDRSTVINFQLDYKPILGKKAGTFICMNPDINSDFSNIKSLKLDTIFSPNNSFTFKIRFEQVGDRKVRGFIQELGITKSLDTVSKLTYFEFPVTVVP